MAAPSSHFPSKIWRIWGFLKTFAQDYMIALYTVLRRGGVNSSLQKMHPLDAEGNKNMGWERGEQGERAVHKQGLQRAWASINQLRKEREEFAYPPASVRAGARGGGYWIFSQESQHRWEREWGGFPERKGEAVSWMEWIEQGWRKRKKVSKVGVSEENEEWKVFLKKRVSDAKEQDPN